MKPVTIRELIAAIGGSPSQGLPTDAIFSRIEIDSRKVVHGDLFWALKGTRTHGQKFVSDALSRGAVAAVVEQHSPSATQVLVVEDSLAALGRFAQWYRSQTDAMIIGVTGSVGKSTTRHLIHAVLNRHFPGVESPRSFNNLLGVPLSLLQLDSQHEYAVLELAATRPGDIRDLCHIARPEVGVLTAIGPAHLEKFGSIESILKTKCELLESLPQTGFAVIDGDDVRLRRLPTSVVCPVIRIGEHSANDVVATHVEMHPSGLLVHADGCELWCPVLGRHHLTAMLMAYTVARELGMTISDIQQGMADYRPLPGRCFPRQIGSWTVIDDTYNANPLSVRAACELLASMSSASQRILVLGEMLELGPQSSHLHRAVGQQVARLMIDRCLVTGAHADDLAAGARELGMQAGRIGVAHDRKLIELLLDCWLQPGDAILLKGSRGAAMETVLDQLQTLADSRTPSAGLRKSA